MSSEDHVPQAGTPHMAIARSGPGAGDELRPIRTSCLRASRDAGESPSPSSGSEVLRHLRRLEWSRRGRAWPATSRGRPSSSTYRVRSTRAA